MCQVLLGTKTGMFSVLKQDFFYGKDQSRPKTKAYQLAFLFIPLPDSITQFYFLGLQQKIARKAHPMSSLLVMVLFLV